MQDKVLKIKKLIKYLLRHKSEELKQAYDEYVVDVKNIRFDTTDTRYSFAYRVIHQLYLNRVEDIEAKYSLEVRPML
jgi:hypothetical protein